MNVVSKSYETPYTDPELRENLLREQLPEVRYIARRIHDRLPPHVPLDDLVHAGVLGLLDAAEKYTPDKNTQFRTYARFRIRGAILDSLRTLDWSPRELRQRARSLEQAERELRNALGRAPTESEIAEKLGISLTDLQDLLTELRGLDLASLDAEGGDSDRVFRNSRDVQAEEPDAFAVCLESERRDLLAKAIEELPEREQQVLSLYYFEELTMKEAGAVLGVTESRVCQIHSAALVRLRGRMRRFLAQPESGNEALLPLAGKQ